MAQLEKTIMQNNMNHFQGKINWENHETEKKEMQKTPPKEMALATLFTILKFVQSDSYEKRKQTFANEEASVSSRFPCIQLGHYPFCKESMYQLT